MEKANLLDLRFTSTVTCAVWNVMSSSPRRVLMIRDDMRTTEKEMRIGIGNSAERASAAKSKGPGLNYRPSKAAPFFSESSFFIAPY